VTRRPTGKTGKSGRILHFMLLGIFANPGLQGSDLAAKVDLAVADFPTDVLRMPLVVVVQEDGRPTVPADSDVIHAIREVDSRQTWHRKSLARCHASVQCNNRSHQSDSPRSKLHGVFGCSATCAPSSLNSGHFIRPRQGVPEPADLPEWGPVHVTRAAHVFKFPAHLWLYRISPAGRISLMVAA